MSASAQTHYLNADFDLGLRPRPRWLEHPTLVRQVRELSAQALLGAEAGDAALIRARVPEEFLDHLDDCGLSIPRVLVHPRVDPDSRLRPFGWSAEAIELNDLHRRPAAHPSPATIARVNSRSFSLELEAELAPDDPPGSVIDSPAELEAFLARADPGSEWVVKAEHGNAGLANRRLRAPHLATADRGFVEGLYEEDDRLVIEPWLPRERDWCVVFGVPFEPSALRIHETTCTRDGALIGALFDPADPENIPWSEELSEMAERTASRLDEQGYFGPVCFDAFSWRDGDRVRLRSLADLNCRLSMSDGAYRLWRRLAAKQTFYYRFFNRRKLDLPAELPQARAALGDRHYDPARRRGILFASPFRFVVEEDEWLPAKLAVIFIAENRSETLSLEREFRARFES
jgi:hypothetical protein